jgi:tetratricopeptide (TPR) repeat protein
MNKLFILFFVCLSIHVTIAAPTQNKHVTDSLLKNLKTANDTQRVNLYTHLAWENRNSNLSITDSFSNIAIELSHKIGFDKGTGNAYLNKGFFYKNFGRYDDAMKAFRWALFHFVKCRYKQGFSSVYNSIAGLHYIQSNYSTALFYYLQSLQISEELNDIIGMARTLNNIGVLYMEQRLTDKALKYYTQSYNLLKKAKDENGIADCLNNLGNVYHMQGDEDKAIEAYSQSMQINMQLGDLKDVSAALNNIGLVFYETNNYKGALDYYHQSLQIDEQMGDIHSIVVSYGNIANCYIKLSMFHAAMKYATQSLEMAKKYNLKTDVMDSYEMLYKIEEAQGNYKDALQLHEFYKAYSDSLFNEETKTEQQRLEAQYLVEKAEKEKIINNKDKEISAVIVKEKEKEISQYILLIGAVLMLFVVCMYVISVWYKKK